MRQGAVLQGEDAAIVRFTLVDMFADPAVRSRLILTFVMSLSVTIGYIGASRVSFRAMSDQSLPPPGLLRSAGWDWPASCKISAP